jgi:hypothetical protein
VLDLKCDLCHKQLDKPGALLFAPPTTDFMCKKYHICCDCFAKLSHYILERVDQQSRVL